MQWGRLVGAGVQLPIFIGLKGPLGAGKSVLARAVAEGAGVEGAVPSPTFNIIFRYPLAGLSAVIHADLFRLRSPAELAGIGWEDALAEHAIMLVEWVGRAGSELPDDRWEVDLQVSADAPDRRTVEITRFGAPEALPSFPVSIR